MFNDREVASFLTELDKEVREVVLFLARRESWPVDDDPEIHARVERLSAHLERPGAKERLAAVDPVAMAGLAAMINMPRSFLLLRNLVDQNPAALERIAAPAEAGSIQQVYQRTVFARISQVARLQLLGRIFSPERRDRLIRILQDAHA